MGGEETVEEKGEKIILPIIINKTCGKTNRGQEGGNGQRVKEL